MSTSEVMENADVLSYMRPGGAARNISYGNFQQQVLIGGTASFATTALETAAGVTVVDASFPVGNVKRYGAVGDGATDDSLAIRDALILGGDVYIPGGTYLVTTQGTKTYRSASHSFCLLVEDNTRVTLAADAIIKLVNAENAHIFMNSGIDAATIALGNVNIEITGGTIDGNKANQTTPASGEQSGIIISKCTGLRLDNITMTAMRMYGALINGITKGSFTSLHVTDSDGSGMTFGLNLSELNMLDCFYDDLLAENCDRSQADQPPGNSFTFTGDDCTIGTITSRDCFRGIKIQSGSKDWTIGSMRATGTTTGAGIRSAGDGITNERISIGQVVTSGNEGAGFQIEDCLDHTIGSIISEGDALGSEFGVWLGESTNLIINSIFVRNSGREGVLFRSDCIRPNVGSITVINSGQVLARSNVSVQGDDVTIGQIVTIDDQVASETVTRGVDVQATCNFCSIGQIAAIGAFTTRAIAHSNNVSIGQVVRDSVATVTFELADATPDVSSGAKLFITSDTTTYTDFPLGWDGQVIRILAKHAATVTDGTNIFTSTGANKTLTVDVVYSFIQEAGNWYELATA